jgi:hypothetical protein
MLKILFSHCLAAEDFKNRNLFVSGNVEQRRCMFSKYGRKLSKLQKIDLVGCQRK